MVTRSHRKDLVNYLHKTAIPFIYSVAIKYDETGQTASQYEEHKTIMESLHRELNDSDIAHHFTILLARDGEMLQLLHDDRNELEQINNVLEFLCQERQQLLDSMGQNGLDGVNLFDAAVLEVNRYLHVMEISELQQFKGILTQLIHLVINFVLSVE